VAFGVGDVEGAVAGAGAGGCGEGFFFCEEGCRGIWGKKGVSMDG
jgi:hypothetical protein